MIWGLPLACEYVDSISEGSFHDYSPLPELNIHLIGCDRGKRIRGESTDGLDIAILVVLRSKII